MSSYYLNKKICHVWSHVSRFQAAACAAITLERLTAKWNIDVLSRTLITVGILTHCPPSSKWVPGGNTGEVTDGEETNWLPYLTVPTA